MGRVQKCPDCKAKVLESDDTCWKCGADLDLRRKWGDVIDGP